ncbi:MAG: uncharacterized protein KVP18_004695 [Porospora cf. gigantea A]|uniref:uncharacterized protein n=1 Tax=Porospora cf. gigantea A TaxID=2853593 RepID=UPI00355A906C|nr:MAG: hypothetical protein KVP18_004695 [Porospora cf. gigantea A]
MADSQGLGVFISDHATLRHEMQAHPRLIPVSIPNFELLHNAAKDSSQKQIIAWSSLLTEWYLMLQVEELVVTNSGFGGTVGMFFNHKNVYDCPKDIKTV